MENRPKGPEQRAIQPLPSDSRPIPRVPLAEFERAQRDPKVQRAIAEALGETEALGESTRENGSDGGHDPDHDGINRSSGS